MERIHFNMIDATRELLYGQEVEVSRGSLTGGGGGTGLTTLGAFMFRYTNDSFGFSLCHPMYARKRR